MNKLRESLEYKQGYESPMHKNPYEYPQELDYQRITLSVKPVLDEQDKKELARLNELVYSTPHQKWADGYWSKIREQEQKQTIYENS